MMSQKIKVKVEFTVKRTVELDAADYIDDHEELFDDEGQLTDEEGLLAAYQEDLEDDDEARDDFIDGADYKDVTVEVTKV